jgi:hypothetical protein
MRENEYYNVIDVVESRDKFMLVYGYINVVEFRDKFMLVREYTNVVKILINKLFSYCEYYTLNSICYNGHLHLAKILSGYAPFPILAFDNALRGGNIHICKYLLKVSDGHVIIDYNDIKHVIVNNYIELLRFISSAMSKQQCSEALDLTVIHSKYKMLIYLLKTYKFNRKHIKHLMTNTEDKFVLKILHAY